MTRFFAKCPKCGSENEASFKGRTGSLGYVEGKCHACNMKFGTTTYWWTE